MTPWVVLMLVPFKANPDLQDVDDRTQALYKKIASSSSSTPSFTLEQLCRENFIAFEEGSHYSINLLHALLFTHEGCSLLQRWLEKNPDELAKIPLEYWLKETQLFNQTLTPLESLVFQDSPILDKFLQQYPDLPFKINPQILYRRSHKGSMIQYLAAGNYNAFLTHLLTANPQLIKQITAEVWYDSSFLDTTPLYWFATRTTGRQLILFLLEQHPSLIDEIPASVWLEKPGQLLEYHHRDKCIVFWLFKSKANYKILDLLADKLINTISSEEWHTLIKSVAGNILNNFGGESQEGGQFFSKLLNRLNNTKPKQGISLKPLDELPLPAKIAPHSPQFFAPASSSKEEEESSNGMGMKKQ